MCNMDIRCLFKITNNRVTESKCKSKSPRSQVWFRVTQTYNSIWTPRVLHPCHLYKHTGVLLFISHASLSFETYTQNVGVWAENRQFMWYPWSILGLGQGPNRDVAIPLRLGFEPATFRRLGQRASLGESQTTPLKCGCQLSSSSWKQWPWAWCQNFMWNHFDHTAGCIYVLECIHLCMLPEDGASAWFTAARRPGAKGAAVLYADGSASVTLQVLSLVSLGGSWADGIVQNVYSLGAALKCKWGGSERMANALTTA